MSAVKKLFGVIWILLAPTSVVLLFIQAVEKTSAAAEGIARTNTALQWGIILFIYIPISIGFTIFGFYSLKGEYDKLDIEN